MANHKSCSYVRKSVAIFLTFIFILSQSLSYAMPSPAGPQRTPSLRASEGGAAISIPEELGRIEESSIGTSGKTIIYIQDAHDSLEAQENIAKIIHYLVEHNGIKTVFEEGYEGDVPTDQYFGFIKDPTIKEKVSYFLLDKLRLGGAEYAHINRTKDFKLIGADSIKLHLENIRWYRENAKHQEETERDLSALQKEIDRLANLHFPKELKEWIKLRKRLNENELSLLDYLKRVRSLVIARRQLPVVGARFPRPRGWETQPLQFSPLRNDVFLYPNITFLLAAGNAQDKETLDKAKTIDPKTLFQEISHLEDDFADSFLTKGRPGLNLAYTIERDQKIFYYHKSLSLLTRLNYIELTPPEYEAVKNTLQSFNTQKIAQFLVNQTKKSIILSKHWEETIQNAIRFYETSQARDEVIEEALDRYVRDIAILVFGGFHKERIKEILKQKNLSFLIVSPKITDIDSKRRDYYKQLMSVGYLPFEIPLYVRQAARAESRFVQVEKGGPRIEAAFRNELRILSESLQKNPELDRSDFIFQAEQELTKIPRSEVRTEHAGSPEEKKGQIEILAPFEQHEDIYPLIELWHQANPGRKLLVFNVDSHTDTYGSNIHTVDLSASWARLVEEKSWARVLHLPSYYREGRQTAVNENWRESFNARYDVFKELAEHGHEYSEIWLTIDYDFFSLKQPFSNGAFSVPFDRIGVFHLDEKSRETEIQYLAQFFKENGIRISRIIPAVSREYLNLTEMGSEEDFIHSLTKQIDHYFKNLNVEHAYPEILDVNHFSHSLQAMEEARLPWLVVLKEKAETKLQEILSLLQEPDLTKEDLSKEIDEFYKLIFPEEEYRLDFSLKIKEKLTKAYKVFFDKFISGQALKFEQKDIEVIEQALREIQSMQVSRARSEVRSERTQEILYRFQEFGWPLEKATEEEEDQDIVRAWGKTYKAWMAQFVAATELPQGARVLHLGPGNLVWLDALAAIAGARVLGIDSFNYPKGLKKNKEAIKRYRWFFSRFGGNVVYKKTKIERQNYNHSSFDMIISMNVLGGKGLSGMTDEALADRIFEWIKPGGKLLFAGGQGGLHETEQAKEILRRQARSDRWRGVIELKPIKEIESSSIIAGIALWQVLKHKPVSDHLKEVIAPRSEVRSEKLTVLIIGQSEMMQTYYQAFQRAGYREEIKMVGTPQEAQPLVREGFKPVLVLVQPEDKPNLDIEMENPFIVIQVPPAAQKNPEEMVAAIIKRFEMPKLDVETRRKLDLIEQVMDETEREMEAEKPSHYFGDVVGGQIQYRGTSIWGSIKVILDFDEKGLMKSEKKFGDIGAGIGRVLATAVVLTDVGEVVGIEMDPYLVQKGQQAIERLHEMKVLDKNRIRWVQKDWRNAMDEITKLSAIYMYPPLNEYAFEEWADFIRSSMPQDAYVYDAAISTRSGWGQRPSRSGAEIQGGEQKDWETKIREALTKREIREATRLYTNHRNNLTNEQRERLKQAIYEARKRDVRSEVRTEGQDNSWEKDENYSEIEPTRSDFLNTVYAQTFANEMHGLKFKDLKTYGLKISMNFEDSRRSLENIRLRGINSELDILSTLATFKPKERDVENLMRETLYDGEKGAIYFLAGTSGKQLVNYFYPDIFSFSAHAGMIAIIDQKRFKDYNPKSIPYDAIVKLIVPVEYATVVRSVFGSDKVQSVPSIFRRLTYTNSEGREVKFLATIPAFEAPLRAYFNVHRDQPVFLNAIKLALPNVELQYENQRMEKLERLKKVELKITPHDIKRLEEVIRLNLIPGIEQLPLEEAIEKLRQYNTYQLQQKIKEDQPLKEGKSLMELEMEQLQQQMIQLVQSGISPEYAEELMRRALRNRGLGEMGWGRRSEVRTNEGEREEEKGKRELPLASYRSPLPFTSRSEVRKIEMEPPSARNVNLPVIIAKSQDIPASLFFAYDEIKEKGSTLWRGLFALASRIQGSKLKLVIYGADRTDLELNEFRDLGVEVTQEGLSEALGTFGEKSNGRNVNVSTKADFLRKELDLLPGLKLKHLLVQDESEIWAAYLRAITDPNQIIPGLDDSQGYYQVVGEFLRSELRRCQANLVIAIAT